MLISMCNESDSSQTHSCMLPFVVSFRHSRGRRHVRRNASHGYVHGRAPDARHQAGHIILDRTHIYTRKLLWLWPRDVRHGHLNSTVPRPYSNALTRHAFSDIINGVSANVVLESHWTQSIPRSPSLLSSHKAHLCYMW